MNTQISDKLKQRFCKDCNLPINLFVDPYFEDRLNLYDEIYHSKDLWQRFLDSVVNNEKYQSEQDYFEEYNKVKDDAINFIKETEAYTIFNMDDMNRYSVEIAFRSFPNKDIFHTSNDGRKFISIDMRKANFSSLRYYSNAMFDGAETWEEFICKFTDNEHIINSKYIRQVILGNCNPKRHITYEKYLMSCMLKQMMGEPSFRVTSYSNQILKRVVFFSNDEVVFDITDMEDYQSFEDCIRLFLMRSSIPFKVETFTLNKIEGTNGYCKDIITDEGIKHEFKCLDSYQLPFVLRKMKGQEIQESDKVFMFEGHLAKFID